MLNKNQNKMSDNVVMTFKTQKALGVQPDGSLYDFIAPKKNVYASYLPPPFYSQPDNYTCIVYSTRLEGVAT